MVDSYKIADSKRDGGCHRVESTEVIMQVVNKSIVMLERGGVQGSSGDGE